jgi:hypothetical protein
LNLNMTKPTIVWHIKTKSWRQQWPGKEGKRLAQQEARENSLGMLAWYLGDGKRHKYDLRYRVGNSEEYAPKRALFLKNPHVFPRILSRFSSKLSPLGGALCALQYVPLGEEPLLGAAALLQQPLPVVLPPYP